MTATGRLLLPVLFAAGVAFGLSPLEGDRIIHQGGCRTAAGTWTKDFVLGPGERPFGFYLNVEGIEEFAVSINGAAASHVPPSESPRTGVRTVDLTGCAGLLRPGVNTISIRPLPGVPEFRGRVWTSDRAWLLGAFHAHTVYSDGVLSVHDLLKRAGTAGARFYGVTDHETMGQCYDTAFHRVGELEPIRGLEWTTDSGHANVLGLAGGERVVPRPIRQMIEEASYRGGLVQVNHPMLPPYEWDHYPEWDPGLDVIEIFNAFNWPRAGSDRDGGDVEAVAWWQELLAGGRTIAASGNSDFHGRYPGEHVLQPCTRVFAPSNDPDTVLKYLKLGRAMACDHPDDTRLYLYADTNSNREWDVGMGELLRLTGDQRVVRFRLEVEDADRRSVVSVWNRQGERYRHALQDGGDYEYEWDVVVSALTRDFFRVELRNPDDDPKPDYEICTNPIYINHPDYELGPTDLAAVMTDSPDSLAVGREDTLRFRLGNAGGYSPYRFGLTVACDDEAFDITGWQTAGPGVGDVKHRHAAGGFEVLEWQGGYGWRNRLSEGVEFEYWLEVVPRSAETLSVLLRAWADDRLLQIASVPDSGVVGPDGLQYCRLLLPASRSTTGGQGGVVPLRTEIEEVRPAVVRDRLAVRLNVAPGEPVRELGVFDAAGRELASFDTGELGPGAHSLDWEPGDARGARPTSGLYFIRFATAARSRTVRFVLVR